MPRDPVPSPMDDRIRAQNMPEAARDVVVLVAGRRREELRTEMPLRRAVVNAIQEIGEAAAKVSPVGKSEDLGHPLAGDGGDAKSAGPWL